jgi:hypothetical protein
MMPRLRAVKKGPTLLRPDVHSELTPFLHRVAHASQAVLLLGMNIS